ncbi:glycosyl transferase family 1 [Salmonella enterica]|nr:glycosyl transferase family 1 [Salmonella enterica]
MKKSKKICLISINSYDELTGGGVYLRTLVGFLLKQNIPLTLIDKKNHKKNFNDNNFKHVSFRKNNWSDIISRLFLLPSFYTVYLFSIFKICKEHDVIAFHNSRLGIILLLVKMVFSNKKIFLFTDNFEYGLVKQNSSNLKSLIEKRIIKFNEKLALQNADVVTYITKHDKFTMDKYYGFEKEKYLIIPVIFIRNEGYKNLSNEFMQRFRKLRVDPRRKFIFTASFDFFPNIDAANKIICKAQDNPDILFILAGRKINSLQLPEITNVLLFDNLSDNEMAALLSESNIFYSPLVMGSGMKTKIAEALFHGLYIYASEHTMIGYEEIINDNNCATLIKDIKEPIPEFIKKESFDTEYIKSMHNRFYSYERFSGNELSLFLS